MTGEPWCCCEGVRSNGPFAQGMLVQKNHKWGRRVSHLSATHSTVAETAGDVVAEGFLLLNLALLTGQLLPVPWTLGCF